MPWQIVRKVRDKQPACVVGLTPLFRPTSRGIVFLASVGFKSLLGGAFSLSQENTGFSGQRFLANNSGKAIRLVADHGGSVDDRLLAPYEIATAQAGALTTILVFTPIKNGNPVTNLLNSNGCAHFAGTANESGESITVGYDAGNGYARTAVVTPSGGYWGKKHVLVISTRPGRDIVVAMDGVLAEGFSGSVSYIGDGSTPATQQPYIGTPAYTEYYHFNGDLSLWAQLPGVFLPAEVARSVSTNPWQIFEPELLPWFIASGSPPQLLAPIADLSVSGWTPSSGTDLYAMLDEGTASDADYIVSSTASSCEMRVATGTDPAVSTGHILRYRLLDGTGAVAVALKQGSTTIASWGPHTLTGVAQDFEQTLSGGEADSITDYSDLRVVFTAS